MTKENSAELWQITDNVIRYIQILQALKRLMSHWDDLLVYVLSSKLDTLRKWKSLLICTNLTMFKQIQ